MKAEARLCGGRGSALNRLRLRWQLIAGSRPTDGGRVGTAAACSHLGVTNCRA